MSNEISYNEDALSLIRKLSDINNQIPIKKSDDGKFITIDTQNPSKTITIEFKAPVDMFDFEGDEISFFDFKEFYALFSVNKEPTIKQTDTKLDIIKDRSKLEYHLAEFEAITDDDEVYCQFDESHASLHISSEMMKKFKTMATITKAETVKLNITGDKILVKFFYEDNQPTYEEEFDLEETATEDFKLDLDAEIIRLTPENDYRMQLNSSGVIKLTWINSLGITLNLYVAEVEEI